MEDNNKRLADAIMAHVGGAGNIASLNHCSTRLRLNVKDVDAFDVEAIKEIPGVLDVVKSMGGYQIIVGNNVSKVYQAIQEAYHFKTDAQGGRVAANPFELLLNTLSDVMGPVIPAIVAAGLVSAVATVCTLAGMSAESTTYQIVYALSQAPFYYLPFMVAYTSARHWGINPVLTMTLAGVLLYPNLVTLMGAGNPIDLFGLPVTSATYTSSLIPMILTCWVMSYVYHFVEQHCPEAIRYVFAPLTTLAVMLPVMLCVTGPVGTWIGDIFMMLVQWMNGVAPGLIVFVFGALAPFMVLTGSHLALLPLVMTSFETIGYDTFMFPAFIGMNFSQFAVSLAIFLKAKNPSLKSTAFSTGLTAFLSGTTEPTLYGLCLRLKRPFIASVIGCVANGVFCAIFGLKCFAFGAPSFFTMVNFVDPSGSSNFFYALGAVAVTIVVTFAATWVLGFDEGGFVDASAEVDSNRDDADHVTSHDDRDSSVSSPVDGELIAGEEVPDSFLTTEEAQASVVIKTSADTAFAPISGEVIGVASSGNEVTLRSDQGIEVRVCLVVGERSASNGVENGLSAIDATASVSVGERVKKGDQIMSLNRRALGRADTAVFSIITVLNARDLVDIVRLNHGRVGVGDRVIAAI